MCMCIAIEKVGMPRMLPQIRIDNVSHDMLFNTRQSEECVRTYLNSESHNVPRGLVFSLM